MAVIREQVFDRLYWSNKALRDFTAEADLDDARLGVEANEMAVDEADFVKIGAAPPSGGEDAPPAFASPSSK